MPSGPPQARSLFAGNFLVATVARSLFQWPAQRFPIALRDRPTSAEKCSFRSSVVNFGSRGSPNVAEIGKFYKSSNFYQFRRPGKSATNNYLAIGCER
jgi:hypothetical protein